MSKAPITLDFIEELLDTFNEMSDPDLEEIFREFQQEQPHIVAFLFAAQEDDLEEEEREYMFYLGLQVWYVFVNAYENVATVSETLIDEVDLDNDDLYQQLDQESEEGLEELVENLYGRYPQWDLLQYCLLAIIESDQEEDEILYDDSKGLVLVSIKTVIDSLDRMA